jgi:sec-independent protein translocase protein TatA
MWGIGTTELVVLLFIVMIVFGAGKLPQVGKSFGAAINEFKNAVKPKDEEDPAAKSDKPE